MNILSMQSWVEKRSWSFVILLFISLSSFATESQQWPDHPEWLWCDDFESGKALNATYQDVSTTGFAISSEDAFDGSHSLCQTYTKGQVDAGWVISVNNAGYPEHLFMRWYHKFENGFEGLPPKMARMRSRLRSGNWSDICSGLIF
jgi:hypothetical protein